MNGRNLSLGYRAATGAGLGVLLVALAVWGILRAGRIGSAQSAETPEVSSQDSQPAFQLRVQRNEVLVRVVVRDPQGHAVTNLQKDDFRLLDNNKPQVITHFSIEKPSEAAAGPSAGPAPSAAPPGNMALPASVFPSRFMALFFDDVHLQMGDLDRTRAAADKYLAANSSPGDRIALFTSSGQDQVDFTDDRQKIHEGLFRLQPRPLYPPQQGECPEISGFQAYKIMEEHDPYATDTAHQEAYDCECTQFQPVPPSCPTQSAARADAIAAQVLDQAENESRYALRGLENVCRRLAVAPGQRSIVLVSPGFLTVTQKFDIDQIIDRALRNNTVIGALDARGLYADIPLGDASHRPIVIPERPDLEGNKVQIASESLQRDADVLAQLADETGGAYFHNSNDYAEGFRRVGALPETYYMLAFSPEDLKLDGRFHTLKVELATNPGHYTFEARRGYFAPNQNQDAATRANEELEQAVFSQEVLNTIPIEVRTDFFKVNDVDAKLSVLTHLDVRAVRFRKADGRNLEHMTLVTALFDRAGTYITGQQKQIEFHLRDATLERLVQSGLTMKTSFAVKPGTYMVREVVHDVEGDQLSSLSRTVEIP
jgi:VWFA-related protein